MKERVISPIELDGERLALIRKPYDPCGPLGFAFAVVLFPKHDLTSVTTMNNIFIANVFNALM